MFPLIKLMASLLLFIKNPLLLDFLPALMVSSHYCSNVVLFTHCSTDILEFAHPIIYFILRSLNLKNFLLTMVIPSLFLTAAQVFFMTRSFLLLLTISLSLNVLSTSASLLLVLILYKSEPSSSNLFLPVSLK